jgi:hypothetical protein
VTDEEFSELAERVQQIEQMTRHAGWPLLIDRATDEIGKRQDRILGGRLELDEYRHETGILAGMLRVFQLPITVRDEFHQLAVARETAKQEGRDESSGDQ